MAFFIAILIPAKSTRGVSYMRTASALSQIHKGFLIYADEHGAYPSHAATLIAEGYFEPQLIVDRNRKSRGDGYLLGDFQLLDFEWSEEDRTMLSAAVGAADCASSTYELGDFALVRLNNPTMRSDIIFGWAAPHLSGRRYVVFDDSHFESLSAAEWIAAWNADAAARRSLSLPPIALPE